VIKKIKAIFTFEYWHIGIIRQPIEQVLKDPDSVQIEWIKYKDGDRFYADPFLYKEDDKAYYLLAEEYAYYDRKGRIVILVIDKKKLTIIKRILLIDEKTHLSFPFYYRDKIYPENYRSGSFYSYTIQPDMTLLKKEEFHIPLIDSVLVEYNGKEYLFGSLIEHAFDEVCGFIKDGDSWTELRDHPLKHSIHTSRMAGGFFSVHGVTYRPVQDSMKCYGNCVRIMQVDDITSTSIKEHEICKISSEREKKYNKACHTFNVYDSCILIDGYETKLRPFYKLWIWIKKHILINHVEKKLGVGFQIIHYGE